MHLCCRGYETSPLPCVVRANVVTMSHCFTSRIGAMRKCSRKAGLSLQPFLVDLFSLCPIPRFSGFSLVFGVFGVFLSASSQDNKKALQYTQCFVRGKCLLPVGNVSLQFLDTTFSRPYGTHGSIGRNGLAKTLLATQLLGSLYPLYPAINTPLHIPQSISAVDLGHHLVDEGLHADNLMRR